MNQEPILSPRFEDDPKPSFSERLLSGTFDILEMFAWSVFAVLIIFTFFIRLCTVDGSSMENSLYHGETLLIRDMGYTPKQDDVVIFHLTKPELRLEKTLVKRVIATSGQTVEVNFKTGKILVDGVEYADEHRTLKEKQSNNSYAITNRYISTAEHHCTKNEKGEQVFSATVPEGCVFVMGDNRNYSLDSRSMEVGFISEDCILGTMLFRFGTSAAS